MLRGTAREAAAEFLGTFILLMFGIGVVAQFVLSGGKNGQYLSINIAWGLGVTMGAYVAAGVSGAHLNPALTLALCDSAGLSLAQGAALRGRAVRRRLRGIRSVVFVTYREALDAFDGGVRQVGGALGTAGIWATYPQPYLSTFPGGFIDQVVGTALLLIVICALTDTRNSAPESKLGPLLVGLLVVAIGDGVRRQRGVRDQSRRATWGRGSSPRWPGGAAASSPPPITGGGCPSSHRRSAPCWACTRTTSSSATIIRRRTPATSRGPCARRRLARRSVMSRFILALDQGTTSSRAIVFRRDGRHRVRGAAGVPADLPVAGARRARSREPSGHRRSPSPATRSPQAGLGADGRRRHRRHEPARDHHRVGPSDRESRSPTRSSGRAASPRPSART